MNRRLLIIFLCALIAGASASYVVYRSFGAQAGRSGTPQMAAVVVAARDLEIGTLIGPADLTMAKWAGPLPKDALLKADMALNRGVIATMYQGEPIMSSRLAPAGSGGGLAATIPPGMRALAVRVNEVVGVAGFVTPGMRVDVLMAGIPPGGSSLQGPQVRTLLQNIQVLSAGGNIQKDSEGKQQQVQVVNLLVTPEQAERLSLASDQMHIQLVLRNPTDTAVDRLKGSAMAELFGSIAPPEPKPATPRPLTALRLERPVAAPPFRQPVSSPPPQGGAVLRFRSVEVLNGSTRTETKFDLQEEHK
jgi:pilus assembly protein CpaB